MATSPESRDNQFTGLPSRLLYSHRIGASSEINTDNFSRPLFVKTQDKIYYMPDMGTAREFIGRCFQEEDVEYLTGEAMKGVIPSGATQPGPDGKRVPINLEQVIGERSEKK